MINPVTINNFWKRFWKYHSSIIIIFPGIFLVAVLIFWIDEKLNF